MIRPFEPPDARRLKANEFSGLRDIAWVWHDPDFYKFTLVDENSDVHCIICFREYWKDCYVAFFLISEDMPPIHARELRNFMDNAIDDLGARRVQTDSIDCKALNGWHEFLGFQCEGIRKQMMYGKDFRSWAIVR